MTDDELARTILDRLDRGPASRDEIHALGGNAPAVARRLVKGGEVHFNAGLRYQRVRPKPKIVVTEEAGDD
jgi:hypothetical protein